MNLTLSDRREDVDIPRAHALLSTTYWAENRSVDAFITACDHSINFSLFIDGELAAFARVVTDYATMFYIGDVIVAPEYRGRGFSKELLGRIMEDARFNFALGMLLTGDAHTLYERFGFIREGEQFMSANRH